MNKTLLPWMHTNTNTEVIGTIKYGIREKKMTAIFGAPGSSKTSILRNYKALKPESHLILCSPYISTKDLLYAIATELNIHVYG